MHDYRRYVPISLRAAADAEIAGADGRPRVTRQQFLPPTTIRVPAISYGVNDLSAKRLFQAPADTGSASAVPRIGVDFFIIRNAVVYTGIGLVTCGDYFFTDLLYHAHLPRVPGWDASCGSDSEGGFVFPCTVPRKHMAEAFHLLAGGADNYFHWMIDVMSRFDSEFFLQYANPDCPPLLIPELDKRYKLESFDLLRPEKQQVIECNDADVIAVDQLIIVPDLSGGAYFPHPGLLRPFADMVTRLSLSAEPPHRRLYISRLDTTQRRLMNEDHVVEAVGAADFEVVSLSGMSVPEQISLFRGASHIIAPHGAGLTNILFCQPQASLLELHMDSYTQWAFRRLSGAVGLSYGCLIGNTIGSWDGSVHSREWKLDIASLETVLASGLFITN